MIANIDGCYESDDIYIIICRKVTKNICNKYSFKGIKNIVFISDTKPDFTQHNVIYYDNNTMINNGFWGMHSEIKITSWDKAFFYLKLHHSPDKYYWIIEDDCYLNKNKFIEYVNSLSKNTTDALFFGWHKSYKNNKNWFHWNKNIKSLQSYYFSGNNLQSSINQIIRLSDALVCKILDFQKYHNRFIFHELLIASLISKFNLRKTIITDKAIQCCAQRKNSIIYKDYKNYNKRVVLRKLENEYIIVHPFKLWYDI